MSLRTLWLVPVCLALSAGCNSTPRLQAPKSSDAVAGPVEQEPIGPTRMQYSSAKPQSAQTTREDKAETSTTKGTIPDDQKATATGDHSGLSFRDTAAPPVGNVRLSATQENALRAQRSDIDLFKSYQRNLPWNSGGGSPFGYPTIGTRSTDRGRR